MNISDSFSSAMLKIDYRNNPFNFYYDHSVFLSFFIIQTMSSTKHLTAVAIQLQVPSLRTSQIFITLKVSWKLNPFRVFKQKFHIIQTKMSVVSKCSSSIMAINCTLDRIQTLIDESVCFENKS